MRIIKPRLKLKTVKRVIVVFVFMCVLGFSGIGSLFGNNNGNNSFFNSFKGARLLREKPFSVKAAILPRPSWCGKDCQVTYSDGDYLLRNGWRTYLYHYIEVKSIASKTRDFRLALFSCRYVSPKGCSSDPSYGTPRGYGRVFVINNFAPGCTIRGYVSWQYNDGDPNSVQIDPSLVGNYTNPCEVLCDHYSYDSGNKFSPNWGGAFYKMVCPTPPAKPTVAKVSLTDNNKKSKAPPDGRTSNMLVESNPFYLSGRIGEDPFKYSGTTHPDSTTMFDDATFAYKLSDHNPIEFKVKLKNPSGAFNITTYEFKLIDTNDSSYRLSIRKNFTHSGVIDSLADNVISFSSLDACLSDSRTYACFSKLEDTNAGDTKTVRFLIYFKNILRNTDYRFYAYVRNQAGETFNKTLDLRDYNWPYSTLRVDTQRPIVTISSSVASSDTLNVDVTVTDRNLDSSKVYLFRTYAYASNSSTGNRFLLNSDNKDIDGTDFNNEFGYTKTRVSANTYKYSLRIKGLVGGDLVKFGVCAYDKAGNVTCIDEYDLAQVGFKWLKTSLGNVYSKEGFKNFPDYRKIRDVDEKPEEVERFISPYNATGNGSYATISNFLVSSRLDLNSFANLMWGYNSFYRNSAYSRPGQLILIPEGWVENLYKVALVKCRNLDGCQVATASTSPGLKNLLESSSHSYKVITASSDMTLDKVACTGKNIVLVTDGTLTLYTLYKRNGLDSTRDACLFLVAENGRVIIDDNPEDSYYREDTDLVDAGFIIGTRAGFVVKQTPHASYKDSNGNLDRLIIHGFVYSLKEAPVFTRDLGITRNSRYPAEWIIYDPNLLTSLYPLFARQKIYTIKCGLLNHPWCRH